MQYAPNEAVCTVLEDPIAIRAEFSYWWSYYGCATKTGWTCRGFGGRDSRTLVIEDVHGWYEHLRQKGVTFEQTPRYNPDYDIYHCFLRDPNGYLIEIQRFENLRRRGW